MPVGFPFFLVPIIFFGYVLLEIAAFIFIGSQIGVLLSLCFVLLSSMGGIWWLKENFRNFSQSFQANINDKKEMGTLLSRRFIGGFGAILLILPGFISSFIGLLCIIPFVQDVLISFFYKHNFFQTSFSFNNFKQKSSKDKQDTTTTIDLNPEEYHAQNPKDSPWRDGK